MFLYTHENLCLMMKNVILRDVTLCDSYKNQRFEETYGFHYQGNENWQARNNVSSNRHQTLELRLLVTAKVSSSSVVTL
jgi:hypothetical protein